MKNLTPLFAFLSFLLVGFSSSAQGQNTVVKQSTDIYISNSATNAVALKVIKPAANVAPFLEFGTQTNTWFQLGATGQVVAAGVDIVGANDAGVSGMRLSHNSTTGEGLLYDMSNAHNILRYLADDGSLTVGVSGATITNLATTYVSGDVHATAYYGDGSNLTGLSVPPNFDPNQFATNGSSQVTIQESGAPSTHFLRSDGTWSSSIENLAVTSTLNVGNDAVVLDGSGILNFGGGAIILDGSTGVGTLNGGLVVGSSGGTITSILTGSATLDFPSTSNGAASELTITVTGAADGDVVSLGAPNGSVPSGDDDYFAFVSAADTVTVRFLNNSGGVIDPASGTFKVMVVKF